MARMDTFESAFQYRDLACVKLCGNIFRGQQHLSQMADQSEAGDIRERTNGEPVVGGWLSVVGCGALPGSAGEGTRPYVRCGSEFSDHFGGGLVQSRHGLYRGINPGLLCFSLLDGR